MHGIQSERSGARHTVVGLLACLCFVLQPLAALLHLACHEHRLVDEVEHHVHFHPEHSHGSDADPHSPSADDAHEDHRPHPVEDHLQELVEPAVLPKLIHAAFALVPVQEAAGSLDAPARSLHDAPVYGPRPPPPRTASAPRAPPLLV